LIKQICCTLELYVFEIVFEFMVLNATFNNISAISWW